MNLAKYRVCFLLMAKFTGLDGIVSLKSKPCQLFIQFFIISCLSQSIKEARGDLQYSLEWRGGLVVSGPTSIGRPFDLEPEPPERAIKWAVNTVLQSNKQ